MKNGYNWGYTLFSDLSEYVSFISTWPSMDQAKRDFVQRDFVYWAPAGTAGASRAWYLQIPGLPSIWSQLSCGLHICAAESETKRRVKFLKLLIEKDWKKKPLSSKLGYVTNHYKSRIWLDVLLVKSPIFLGETPKKIAAEIHCFWWESRYIHLFLIRRSSIRHPDVEVASAPVLGCPPLDHGT